MKNVIFISLIFILSSCLTDNGCKEYIINHKSEIKKEMSSLYSIDKYKGFYYTEITISDGRNYRMDSVYRIIFWGNRNSWLWDFKKDKYFSIDIPYNRYKGKNVKLDEKLYNIITNIK